MERVFTISGLSALGFFVGGLAVPLVFPRAPAIIGYSLVGLAVILLSGAFAWHLRLQRKRMSRRLQKKLTRAFFRVRPAFEETNAGLEMMVVEHDEDALAYAKGLSNAIQSAGITVSPITHQIPASPDQSGLIVATLDAAKPTALAVCILQALHSAGVTATYGPLPPVLANHGQSRIVGLFVVTAS